MTAKIGRTQSKPFKFDHEKVYSKYDNDYVTKTVTKGSDRDQEFPSLRLGQSDFGRELGFIEKIKAFF